MENNSDRKSMPKVTRHALTPCSSVTPKVPRGVLMQTRSPASNQSRSSVTGITSLLRRSPQAVLERSSLSLPDAGDALNRVGFTIQGTPPSANRSTRMRSARRSLLCGEATLDFVVVVSATCDDWERHPAMTNNWPNKCLVCPAAPARQ